MKKNKLPSLVVILILTLVTGVVWISFSVYRALTTKPPPIVPPEISNPINPALDTQTLGQVGSRLFLDNSQLPEISIGPSSAPSTQKLPAPVVSTPVATGSATPTATSSATP